MDQTKFEPPMENPEVDDAPKDADNKKPAGYSAMAGFQTVLSIAIVMATLLTFWNPRKLLSTPNLSAMLRMETSRNLEPTAEKDTSTHIGILAGHWQDSTGEVCADGLIEADVNQAMTSRVAENLTDIGYEVDIFPEYDLALLNYRGVVFVAIYSGSCAENPLPKSGFKVSTSLTAKDPEKANDLAVCLSEAYQEATKLAFSYEVLNPDHPSYHIFRDIHGETPAVMIEVGSLKTDRNMIVGKSDTVSKGITAGILCYLNQLPDAQK